MKIYEREVENYSYVKPLIEKGRCNLCLGYNTLNGFCIDCQKKDINLYYKRRNITKKTHTLNMKFPLSRKQEEASKFFLKHLIIKEDAFLFAVCGSGKTEIMYESILYALNEGEKVAFAIPRKEIVKELYDRLTTVFKDTKIKYIDGTHHDDDCDLLLTTVNQLIHFEHEFDLLILDEADAFPYSTSFYLKRILRKSIKTDGIFFQMSATLKEKPRCDVFTMNRRYHQHDLSMPLFIRQSSNDYTKLIELNSLLSQSDRKFIIYVPSIKKAQDLAENLNTKYVSSKNPDSSEILSEFKNGNMKTIVSTTLLERGITVKNLDVIILDADDDVFTRQTIIQICGRVGRSYDDPTGNIFIFKRKNSIKFYLVKRYIKKMNKDEMQHLS